MPSSDRSFMHSGFKVAHYTPQEIQQKLIAAKIAEGLAGQIDPGRIDDEEKPSNSFEEVVSREGIEPSTRRLRVCCSAN